MMYGPDRGHVILSRVCSGVDQVGSGQEIERKRKKY